MIRLFAKLKLKYLLSAANTPIDKIYFSETDIRENEKGFESGALLKEKLVPDFFLKNKFSIYGNIHGCGSDQIKEISMLKAASEAIERWAFWSTYNSKERKKFGFDKNESTTGMAAFVGFSKHKVKKMAFNEAAERWAITEWWSGNLPTISFIYKTHDAFEILIPIDDVSVVVLHKEIQLDNNIIFHAYGFAGHSSRIEAAIKAEVELIRNCKVLKNFYVSNKDSPNITVTNMGEKRLLHFAGDNGYRSFMQKLEESENIDLCIRSPLVMINNEITGPWSKYAFVWRILFENFNKVYDEKQIDVFMF